MKGAAHSGAISTAVNICSISVHATIIIHHVDLRPVAFDTWLPWHKWEENDTQPDWNEWRVSWRVNTFFFTGYLFFAAVADGCLCIFLVWFGFSNFWWSFCYLFCEEKELGFLFSPIFGKVRPGGTGSWSPRGCNGRRCWSSNRSSGGSILLRDGCKIAWKRKWKANVWNRQ